MSYLKEFEEEYDFRALVIIRFFLFSIPVLHSKVVNIIRNLMTSHDLDVRYAEPDCKARVAALYLPLLVIVMDMLPQLYSWNNDTKSRFRLIVIPSNRQSW